MQEQVRPARLSYHEKRELEALPTRIEDLESELEAVHRRLSEPEFYKGDPGEIREVTERSDALEEEIARAFQRWEELAERG